MLVTEQEKKIAAQIFFDKCFTSYGTYSICGINSLYQFINGGGNNLYQDGMDEVFKDYKFLSLLNGLSFKDFPPETKVKVITATQHIFSEMGYMVDVKASHNRLIE